MEWSLASGYDSCQGMDIQLAIILPGLPARATVGQDGHFRQ
jgi:3-oxoacyl-ACP reductase-like protein